MPVQIRSADQIVRLVEHDPARQEALKQDPVGELKKLSEDAKEAVWVGDVLIYRVAIVALAVIGVIALLGAIGLVSANKDIPQVVVSLGSAAIGALVGVFSPSPMATK